MAAQQFTLTLTPGRDNVKKDVAITTPLVDPGDDEIWVGFGTDVLTRRGTEITGGLQKLVDGIRDRKLIDEGTPLFKGSALVTAVNLDVATVDDRRTSSSLAGSVVADADIVVAMGVNVTDLTYRTFHETSFEQLIRAVQEWLHKNG